MEKKFFVPKTNEEMKIRFLGDTEKPFSLPVHKGVKFFPCNSISCPFCEAGIKRKTVKLKGGE